MARRDHLGNNHLSIEVILDAAPATTTQAHGLDLSKVIYVRSYVENAAQTVSITDTDKTGSSWPTYLADSILMDDTNFVITTGAGQTGLGVVTFEIIMTD
jgi:hypothetical protein